MTRVGRIKVLKMMFDRFNFISCYVASGALMSLFAAGLFTGLVVDIGNRMQIIPVVDGIFID